MRNRTFLRGGARAALLASLLAAGACDLDLTNPNSPPEELVLTTPDGIIALAVGMQSQFAGTGVGTGLVLNSVRTPALVTDEWSTTTLGLAADRSLISGQGVDASFGVVTSPYTTAFRVMRSAEELLENAPTAGLSTGTLAGVNALARTFKAMSMGIIIQQYQQVPVTATLEANPVKPRAEVLDSVLSLLEQARTGLASVPAADLADFTARIQGPGYVLSDVINAMLARYYLIDGQYQQAIDAANRVTLTRLNVFTYPDPNVNPVWGYWVSVNYVRGLNEFVTEADPEDDRPAYWLRTDQPTQNGNPAVTLRNLRQYADRNSPFPVFLPDEMRLIRAEAHARLGQFPEARTLINTVRTQCTPAASFSTMAEPVACMPALSVEALDTQAEVLAEVAYQRRYELYLQGTRWEDIRRLGAAVVGETPSIQWLPLPQGECVNNPGVSC